MSQEIFIAWVDGSIDETNSDSKNTLEQLRLLVNEVNTFRTTENCIEFVKQLQTDKVVIITSGSLGQNLVQQIHGMTIIDSIYIFCNNVDWHRKWAIPWVKIVGVHNRIQPICDSIRNSMLQWIDDTVLINFIQEDNRRVSILYAHLLKKTLSEVNYHSSDKKHLVRFCQEQYAHNPHLLTLVEEFDQQYRPEKSIWWYTKRCFIHRMVNRALENFEVDLSLNLAFFIHHLHEQLEDLYEKQRPQSHQAPFTVYRGQGLSKDMFERLSSNQGKLILFHSFLAAFREKTVPLEFAKRVSAKGTLVGVVFALSVDPKLTSTVFADIEDNGYLNGRGELLFSMDAIFYIKDIRSLRSDQQLFEVELELVGDDHPHVWLLKRQMDEEIKNGSAWQGLGDWLIHSGQSKKAEDFYLKLLDRSVDPRDRARCTHSLALIKQEEHDDEGAIRLYEQELLIIEGSFPPNDFSLAQCHNNLGLVYYDMKKYAEALLHCQKALDILEILLHEDDADLATSYNCVGTILYHLGDDKAALSLYEKSLKIREKIVPSNHASLAAIYYNMAVIYDNRNQYLTALFFYQKTLAIDEKTVPRNNELLGALYNHIGAMHYGEKEYTQALTFFEKALNLSKGSYPSTAEDAINWIKSVKKTRAL